MNRVLKRVRSLTGVVSLSALLLVGAVGSAYAAPAAAAKSDRPTPPATSFVSGLQDKPAIEPGSRDAKLTERLGPTDLAKVDAEANLQVMTDADVAPLAGNVAGVDFLAPLNYCSRNLSYTPVKNTTAVTKYVQVRIYNQSSWRDIYTTVAANTTVYPASYGINGSYSAYLYVWNGSSYQYDEFVNSANNCNVRVTRVANANGWVQLKIENLGTAYATQRSTELAPFPTNGTYTGNHYDYPAAGGAAIYRWFWVGTSPYGIVSTTVGSFNSPYYFTGDL